MKFIDELKEEINFDEEHPIMLAILQGDVEKVGNINQAEATAINMPSNAYQRSKITPFMLAALSGNPHMLRKVASFYNQEALSAQLKEKATTFGGATITYGNFERFNLLSFAVLSDNPEMPAAVLSLYPESEREEQLNYISKHGRHNQFMLASEYDNPQGLQALASLYSTEKLKKHLSESVVKGDTIFSQAISTGSLLMLGRVVSLFDPLPELKENQLQTILVAAVYTGNTAILNRTLTLWPQMRSQLSSTGGPYAPDNFNLVLHAVGSKRATPEMLEAVLQLYPEDQRLAELCHETDKNYHNAVTRAVDSRNPMMPKAVFALLPAEVQAHLLVRHVRYDRKLPNYAVMISSKDLNMLKAILDLYPNKRHRALALLHKQYQDSHILITAAINSPVEITSYLLTNFSFPPEYRQEGYDAALEGFTKNPSNRVVGQLIIEYHRAFLLEAYLREDKPDIIKYKSLLGLPANTTLATFLESLSPDQKNFINWKLFGRNTALSFARTSQPDMAALLEAHGAIVAAPAVDAESEEALSRLMDQEFSNELSATMENLSSLMEEVQEDEIGDAMTHHNTLSFTALRGAAVPLGVVSDVIQTAQPNVSDERKNSLSQ